MSTMTLKDKNGKRWTFEVENHWETDTGWGAQLPESFEATGLKTSSLVLLQELRIEYPGAPLNKFGSIVSRTSAGYIRDALLEILSTAGIRSVTASNAIRDGFWISLDDYKEEEK